MVVKYNANTTKGTITYWMEVTTTFSLEDLFEEKIDLFNEDEIDKDKLKVLIDNLKRNKLYDLFKKECLNKPLVKRRRSPGEETTAKLRRLSISSGSSPSLRRGRKVIKPDRNFVFKYYISEVEESNFADAGVVRILKNVLM